MILHKTVAFGGTLVVVEGDARRDHVQHRRALVGDGAFQQRQQLPLVAGKRPSHVSGAQLDGQGAGVNRRQVVDHAGLQFRADVGRGGELSFGQAVNAVVLDDVNHRQIPAHQVNKLPDADGSRVAVAR